MIFYDYGRILMLGKKAKKIGEPFTRKERAVNGLICFLCCTVASVIMAFNLNSFVDTGGLFPGGFAGVTLLIQRGLQKYMHIAIAYSVIYLPLNLIPIVIGIKFLGKRFTIYSIYVTVLTSVLTDMMPQIPVTYDILLICIFGGIINGASMALCLIVGASSGGTDFISIYLSDQKGIDAYDYIFGANVVLLVLAGAMFGLDKALYSIVYQYATTQVIHMLYQRYTKRTLMIITDHPEAVYSKIKLFTNHDATLFKGEGLYRGMSKNLIYSIVNTDEVDMLIKLIHDVDPRAFINVMKTEELSGAFFNRETR